MDLQNVKKFRVTRWKELIFPTELIIDQYRVLSRKRRFPAFWIIKEESIPLRSVASIQIARGLLFSGLIVENSGGPFPIRVNGIPNRKAREIRQIIECYEPVRSTGNKVGSPTHTIMDNGIEEKKIESKRRPAFNPFKVLKRETKSKDVESEDIVIESWENSWGDVDFARLDENKTSAATGKLNHPKRDERSLVSQTAGLPSIDDVLDESDRKKSISPGWIDDIVTPISKISDDKSD